MGGEAADRASGVVAAGNLLVKPTPAPAPGTKGEALGRRASGFGRNPRRRTKEWFKLQKGERGGGEGGGHPARSGRVAVATYNIQNDRSGGLLSTMRALDQANVNIAAVQEVKLKDPKFALQTGF